MTNTGNTLIEAAITAALHEGAHARALTLAIRGYGPEVCGYLVATLGNEADGKDAFSLCCEDMVAGVKTFRASCSFRTWMYTLARNAAHRLRRDPRWRRRHAHHGDAAADELADAVRESTVSYLQSNVRNAISRLREALPPDDRELLILRVDRGLEWAEIAQVLAPDADPGDQRRLAATMRKRYERLKAVLREAAEREGVISPREKR